MIIAETIVDLKSKLDEFRTKKLKTGFIPTMGALHEGHLSLVQRAKAENDKVVVSIFVNPTQFNNPEDLKKYPRMAEKDFELLRNEGVDVVFIPSVQEIYPEGLHADSKLDFGNLEKVLEGEFRPGHFKGVGQVVSILFEIVDSDTAYFGEKDFQQLVIIKELVRKKNFRVKITGCPTVREPDGLAMSSRNLLLSPELRREATKISQALFYIRDHRNEKELPDLSKEAIRMIESSSTLKVQYLEVADEHTLQPVMEWKELKTGRCLVAVMAGNIRLIDNVQV